MRLLKKGAAAMGLTLGMAAASTGCWGDEVPSLDRVGAIESESGGVEILFASCPNESVDRIQLNLTDDDFDRIDRALWEIVAESSSGDQSHFTVGSVPNGFREVIALGEPLDAGDHVQIVVTASTSDTIPMSFLTDDLPKDEVLVRQNRYRTPEEFNAQSAKGCPRG